MHSPTKEHTSQSKISIVFLISSDVLNFYQTSQEYNPVTKAQRQYLIFRIILKYLFQ